MKKEVENHVEHLKITFDLLLKTLFTAEEMDDILALGREGIPFLNARKSWIRTSDLVLEGITTEKMALIHLLWFQHIGRVVIEDIDPFSGAILIHLGFADFAQHNEAKLQREN